MSTAPPKRWHTREDSGIRLDRHGRWWHDDEPIEHPKIIEAFNTGLTPTEDGKFRLQFGNDWCYVQVEDAAYSVLDIDFSSSEPTLTLSDRSTEPLDPMSVQVAPDGVLTCRVKQGRAKARFSRDAQFALGDHLERRGDQMILRLGSKELALRMPPIPHV